MNLLLFEDEKPKDLNVEGESSVDESTIPEDEETNVSEKVSYNYVGTIEISKIKLKRGFLDIFSPYNNVDRNVTVIQQSSFPNVEHGNLILAAHSGNCSICYFDKLYKLSIGDKALVYYKNYKYSYNFIPPFVLTKILTFGVISRYYGLLKQNDRQDISKYFKISDKLLKQILANLTMVRNISAHSDRLFCYRNKYYISFKNIDKNYKRDGNFTNIYMIIECMKVLLDQDKFKEFEDLFYIELGKLKESLNSIDVNDILRIMGFNV